jgi:hypothetical protein
MGNQCTFAGCGNDVWVKSLGLCNSHYRQHHNGRELTPIRVAVKTCTFPDCGRPHMSQGLCDGHVRQVKRGRELKPLRVTRSRGESLKEMARGVRTCVGKNGCGRTLPLSQFSKHRKTADGYVTNCKDCSRSVLMKLKYDLTQVQWDALFDSQGRCCAICRTDTPGFDRWATDHDHSCCPGQRTCGKCVRAILCITCNTMVGFIESNPNFAEALNYVASNPRALAEQYGDEPPF